jgi:cell division protein FtsL
VAARRVGRGGRSSRRGRGRSIVALFLVGFVLVAVGVIWRRTYGVAQSRALRELDRRRLDLVAQRTRLESDIRDLSSRARLAPIAEQRLKMHVPNDSQVVILGAPPASRAAAARDVRP